MGKTIRNFRELTVYRLAFEFQQEIFRSTRDFPRSENYAFTNQIRRSSRSIGANIAKAWHKRLYPAHFISKLSDADGEQAETQHWLDTAAAREYLLDADRTRLLEKCLEIGRILGGMMRSPEKFCASSMTGTTRTRSHS